MVVVVVVLLLEELKVWTSTSRRPRAGDFERGLLMALPDLGDREASTGISSESSNPSGYSGGSLHIFACQ